MLLNREAHNYAQSLHKQALILQDNIAINEDAQLACYGISKICLI